MKNSSEGAQRPRSPHIDRNIRAVADIEQKSIAERSVSEKIGDLVNRTAGRMWFIGLHLLWFAAWVYFNSGKSPMLHPLDPYPFELLTLVVSLESIFLSLFLLLSQNRANRQAEQRAHLDLQINLLAEIEMTKLLRMVQALCKAHNLNEGDDPELQDLNREIEPGNLIQDLKASLPPEV